MLNRTIRTNSISCVNSISCQHQCATMAQAMDTVVFLEQAAFSITLVLAERYHVPRLYLGHTAEVAAGLDRSSLRFLLYLCDYMEKSGIM